MAYQTHAYDSEAVLRQARQRAARVSSRGAWMVVVSCLLLALGAYEVLSQPVVLILLAMGWLFTGGWIGRRLQLLRQLTWYVRITPSCIVGSDYVRHSTRIPWSSVAYLNVSDDMLTIVGPGLSVLKVPPLFVGYGALVRAVVDQAMAHGARVYVDGTPLDHAPLTEVTSLLDSYPHTPDDPTS